MTEGTEARFWQDLRQQLASDEQEERRTLAEAEQMLSELDAEQVEPLAPERIEAMTIHAMSADDMQADDMQANDDAPATEAAAGEPATEEPSGGRVLPLHGVRKGLTAAAALLVAPKFLVAATAVTTLTIAALVLRNTLHSLPFQDAVAMMVDVSLPAETRRTAEGRAFNRMVESIQLLQAAASNGSTTTNDADRLLERVRQELDATTPFEFVVFPQAHRTLAERATATELSPVDRLRAMERLTDQVVYGVRALRAVRDRGGPDVLLRVNAAHLAILDRLVGR